MPIKKKSDAAKRGATVTKTAAGVAVAPEIPSKPRSAALEAIHNAATGLHKVGAMDKTTMREFDEACLMPVPLHSGRE